MAGNSTIARTINTDNEIVNVIVTFRSREEQVNGSICEISSLEVYRGREQATNISHQGFSLTENGTIKVYWLHNVSYNILYTIISYPCRFT